MRKVVNAFGIIICLMLLPLSGCESYYEFSQEYGIELLPHKLDEASQKDKQ